MLYLTPIPKQFLDESGIPCSGGTVTVYEAGTTDKAQVHLDAYGEQLQKNPAVLNSSGVWQCFVPLDTPLDYVVMDVEGNVIDAYERVTPVDGTMSTMLWIFCSSVQGEPDTVWLYQQHLVDLLYGLKWLGDETMMVWPTIENNVTCDEANEIIQFNYYVEG